MHAWEAIQSTVDYIEDNIKNDLSINQLADFANLSMYYYQRLFTRLVKKPVSEYIKLRRVANAKVEIRETNKTILNIALSYGFQSHASFTKSFKEIYHITPTQYRNGDMKLTDFLKPNLILDYTMIHENIPFIVEDMILEIRSEVVSNAIYYTGIHQYNAIADMNRIGVNTLVTLWDQFHATKKNIPNLKQDGEVIDYFTYASQPGKVEYFVGGESNKQLIDSYAQVTLQEGQYYVCTFEAENFEFLVSDALYKANKYFFEVWLKNKQITMDAMEPFLIQKYYKTEQNPKIEIWIKPLSTISSHK